MLNDWSQVLVNQDYGLLYAHYGCVDTVVFGAHILVSLVSDYSTAPSFSRRLSLIITIVHNWLFIREFGFN